MPTSSVLNRVSGNDFFAVLAPGLFNFLSLYCVFMVLNNSLDDSFGEIMVALSNSLVESPLYILFVIFLSYLLGSVFRALPVGFAEKLIPPFTAKFPYPDMLRDVVSNLKNYSSHKNIDKKKFPTIDESFSKDVYNYWKGQLCIQSKDGFFFYQSFETRSRFFAGMLWASVIGVFCSIIILFDTGSLHPLNSAGGPIFFFSFLLFFTFGLNFRRIRRQEARALLSLHVSLNNFKLDNV